MRLFVRETLAPTLALFTSLSTLICCALPALFITVGAGAVMAGLVSNVPGLVWLTEQKPLLFTVAGIFLSVSIVVRWATRHAPCPVDPVRARACTRLRRLGSGLLASAVVLYLIGGFFAFFAADLLL